MVYWVGWEMRAGMGGGGKERFGFGHVTSYICTMSKNTITIDLSVWTTQTAKAKAEGLNESTIRQRVCRTKKGKGLTREEYWHIPELSITLVKK